MHFVLLPLVPQEHTAGNLQYYVYHGADRTKSPTFLASHDLVVTTYKWVVVAVATGQRESNKDKVP